MYIIIHCRILTIRRVHIMSEGSPYGSLMEITRNSFNCDSLDNYLLSTYDSPLISISSLAKHN